VLDDGVRHRGGEEEFEELKPVNNDDDDDDDDCVLCVRAKNEKLCK
jgi:hypothetical protein